MNRKQAGIGLGVGVAAFVGLIALSGQYVPPTGSVPALTTGGGLVVTSGKVGLTTSCATGERLEWDGSAWQCRVVNDYRSKHIELNEDYLVHSCVHSAPCGSTFTDRLAGTNASIVSTGTTTRPGILDMQTGSTSTGQVGLFTNLAAFDFASFSTTTFEVTLGFPTLSTGSERYATVAGYFDAMTVDQVDGCYFLYDEGDVATDPGTGSVTGGDFFSCWCASNSTRTGYTMNGSNVSQDSFTTVSAPVAALTLPDTNMLDMKIVVESNTRARFYVNGVESCRITTNIPSGTARREGAGINIIKSVGSTARDVYIDRTRLAIDLLTARSL